ncbi:MAG: OmpA family protein [Methylobacillus sp.]|nr:OmpA family protein [Methylobacillus sp.]
MGAANSNYKLDTSSCVVPPAPEAEAAPVTPPPAPEPEWKTVTTEKHTVVDGANFVTGSAKLLQGADDKLGQVLQAANDNPDIKIKVDGYTDNVGKRAVNQNLSERRAAAVKDWLVERGVAANRITTAGFADASPIASNATAEGRAANRRVEVSYTVREEKQVRVDG